MTTFLVSGPDEAEKFAQFKKVAKALGYTVKRTQEKVAKKPRTRIEQDLVDAYKETLAAEKGDIQLQSFEDFLLEVRAEKATRNAG
jgi:ATP-dependent exoDNAse (exonuclease V) beta subunit